jgi:hypothetical protein
MLKLYGTQARDGESEQARVYARGKVAEYQKRLSMVRALSHKLGLGRAA